MKRRIATCLCLLLGLSFAGCGDDAPLPDAEKPEMLAELGGYTVGIRQTTVTYEPPGQEEAREIPAIVWYPANEPGERRVRLTLADLLKLPTEGYSKVPIADNGPYPVVVHSHGSGGEASLAYPAAEVFASRGWVVISISHVGNTTMDAIGDPLDVPMYIPVYRMLDVQHTLDYATAGFDAWEGFAENVDTENVFMYGHSFGGYTSMAVGGATFLRDGAKNMVCENAGDDCEEGDVTCGQHNPEACAFLDEPEIVDVTEKTFRDPRIQAIALQAPGALGMIDPSTVEVPSLLMSANKDAWLPLEKEAQPIWSALKHPDDLWLQFEDAGHLTFITVCEENVLGAAVVNNFMPAVGGDGCNEEYMSSARMADVNTAYMVMFAEKHLLGVNTWDAYLRGENTLELTSDVQVDISTHD